MWQSDYSNVKLCYEKQVGEPLRSQKTWANSRVGLFCSMNCFLLWQFDIGYSGPHVSRDCMLTCTRFKILVIFDGCYCNDFHFFKQINMKILKLRHVWWNLKILTIMKYQFISLLTFKIVMTVFHDYKQLIKVQWLWCHKFLHW